MTKWILAILTTAILSFLTYISTGVMEAKTLEHRVGKLEGWSTRIDADISSFKSDIKHDIGTIKGQNEIIIKILQNRSGYERDK